MEPVDASDGLQERVLLERLVDVEDRRAGRVEAGDQLADHDEQLDARLVVGVLLEAVDDVLVVGLLVATEAVLDLSLPPREHLRLGGLLVFVLLALVWPRDDDGTPDATVLLDHLPARARRRPCSGRRA